MSKSAFNIVSVRVAILVRFAAKGLLVACALMARGASGETVVTVGSCSPVLNNVSANGSVQITCNGSERSDLRPLLDQVTVLHERTDEAIQYLQSVLLAHKNDNISALPELLLLANEQLRQTRRLQYALSDAEIPITVTARFNASSGALASYGGRVRKSESDRRAANPQYRGPAIYPFPHIEWLNPVDDYFPKPTDGSAYEYLRQIDVTIRCYSKEQRASSAGPQIEGAKTIADVNQLPVSPYLAQTVNPRLGACGVGYSIGDLGSETWAIVRGVRVLPKADSVARPASLTSALDMFGSVCFVLFRNDAFPITDDARKSTSDALLLGVSLHLTKQLEYRNNQNNFRKIDAGPGYQVFRWEMPAELSALSKLTVIGGFPDISNTCSK